MEFSRFRGKFLFKSRYKRLRKIRLQRLRGDQPRPTASGLWAGTRWNGLEPSHLGLFGLQVGSLQSDLTKKLHIAFYCVLIAPDRTLVRLRHKSSTGI